MLPAIKQNATGLKPEIQSIGCFFRAALRMAEYAAERAGKIKYRLTKKQINALWDECKSLGLINERNCVVQSAPIANLGLTALKVSGRFTEVATFMNGTMQWYRNVPTDKRRADFHIQKIAQNGPNGTHYINIDKYGTLLWDPHEPAITKCGVFYTICYRYDGDGQNE